MANILQLYKLKAFDQLLVAQDHKIIKYLMAMLFSNSMLVLKEMNNFYQKKFRYGSTQLIDRFLLLNNNLVHQFCIKQLIKMVITLRTNQMII